MRPPFDCRHLHQGSLGTFVELLNRPTRTDVFTMKLEIRRAWRLIRIRAWCWAGVVGRTGGVVRQSGVRSREFARSPFTGRAREPDSNRFTEASRTARE